MEGGESDVKDSNVPYRKDEELNIDHTTELPAGLLTLRKDKYEMLVEGPLNTATIDEHFTAESIVLYQDGRALLLWFGKELGNATRKDAVKYAVYYLKEKGIDKSVQLSMMYESEQAKELLRQRYSA